MTHLKELTSLRAFAAFVVVIFHMFFDEGKSGLFQTVISKGHLGVDLFFILSGFILTYVYSGLWCEGRFSYAGFLQNRFARVYPLHLVMIGLFVLAYQAARIMGMSGFEGEDYAALPYHLLVLHAWGFTGGHAWNFPSWSISAEAFAYLSFPLVLAAAMRIRVVWTLPLALVVFALTHVLAESTGTAVTKRMFDFGILRIAGEFTIGVALGRIFLAQLLPATLARPGGALALLALAICVVTGVNESLIVLVIAALLMCVALLAQDPRDNLLRSRWLVYLGEISYATYMVHILVIISVREVIPAPWSTPVTLALVYLGSVVLYHAVEVPARKLLRGWFGRRA